MRSVYSKFSVVSLNLSRKELYFMFIIFRFIVLKYILLFNDTVGVESEVSFIFILGLTLLISLKKD